MSEIVTRKGQCTGTLSILSQLGLQHRACPKMVNQHMTQHQFPRWLLLTASPEALGSTFSSGTSTPSMIIMPVAEARKENLPSILGAERPRIPFSSRKPRMQLSSHRAHTTNRSATGELVILGVGQGVRVWPPPSAPAHPSEVTRPLTKSWPH